MTPNSQQPPGKKEYEDKANFMRRDTWNTGCQEGPDATVLGVTYDAMYLPDTDGVPPGYPLAHARPLR